MKRSSWRNSCWRNIPVTRTTYNLHGALFLWIWSHLFYLKTRKAVLSPQVKSGNFFIVGKFEVGKTVHSGKLSRESDGLESCSREKDVAPIIQLKITVDQTKNLWMCWYYNESYIVHFHEKIKIGGFPIWVIKTGKQDTVFLLLPSSNYLNSDSSACIFTLCSFKFWMANAG